ncbi:response regulator [Domibacillus indicus]|uniref:response regulator n=1 Tax=Domibacillus indicus TaxID=1437523 RepID=UPI000617D008|nr:response regulator [Domibacillus indicus]
MLILIVEDDINKIAKIESFLKSEFINIQIEKANSYNSGLRKILFNKYDLVLLDMTMPNFDKTSSSSGGKLVQFAGKEILSQMKRKKIFIPVIMITQYASFGENDTLKSFDEMLKELREEFSTTLLDMIYYEAGKSDWEIEIKKLLEDFNVC